MKIKMLAEIANLWHPNIRRFAPAFGKSIPVYRELGKHQASYVGFFTDLVCCSFISA
jgi:hypothetical protein